jgi:hypothetical protein
MRTLVIFATILVGVGLGAGYYLTQHAAASPEKYDAPAQDPPSTASTDTTPPSTLESPTSLKPSPMPERPLLAAQEAKPLAPKFHRSPVPIDARVQQRLDELTNGWTIGKRIDWAEEQINLRSKQNVRDDQ